MFNLQKTECIVKTDKLLYDLIETQKRTNELLAEQNELLKQKKTPRKKVDK